MRSSEERSRSTFFALASPSIHQGSTSILAGHTYTYTHTMPATPKSTPKKGAANGTGTPAASPSASTPSRMTRAQARATGTKIKTPSPLKKGTSTPKASAKKAAAPAPDATADEEEASPSPSKSKAKTPTKAASPNKASPKKSVAASPSKVPASHAKLTRKPTSALATAEPIVAEYSEEEEEQDDDEEEEDEEDDSDLEDGQDVSEKGMQRLMAALGEDGLDEVDMAALDELAGDEEEDEEEDEEDEEEDEDEEVEAEEDEEEGEEAEEEDDADIPRVIPNANGDTLAASIARSGLAEAIESEDEEDSAAESEQDDDEEDPEAAIAYEDLPDDIELSEQAKASRVQRIKINNEAALTRIYSDIRLDSPSSSSKLPWIETMRVTYPTSISSEVTDVENDLERELAFYKQALHAAIEGKKLVEASGTPFTRPADYFAEMVKTDEHMERIRQKLLDESAAIKASEAAKKQRELKKFGKKVQVEKLQERIRNKKEMNERIQGLKRKHGSTLDDNAGDDDFDVRVEAALDDRPAKKAAPAAGKGGRAPTNKSKMPRSARDAKYGFGGKKKYSKSNTAESTNDFRVGPTRGARGSKPSKGGKPTSGKAGFRPKQKSGAARRPGKARRAGH